MIRKIPETRSPGRLARALYRAPAGLYRWHLGWLLGGRFLLLEHRGRKSGQWRQTVLEVVRHDRRTGAWVVASGFGEKSNWFRNVQVHPETVVHCGTQRVETTARRLELDETRRELLDYARRHPRAMRSIARVLGFHVDGTDEDIRELAQHIPMVRLGLRTEG